MMEYLSTFMSFLGIVVIPMIVTFIGKYLKILNMLNERPTMKDLDNYFNIRMEATAVKQAEVKEDIKELRIRLDKILEKLENIHKK